MSNKRAEGEENGVVGDVAVHALYKVSNEVFESLVPPIKKYVAKRINAKFFNIDEYSRHLALILNFKTIASNDKYVNVNDIYVPLWVKPSDDVAFEISDRFTLETHSKVIIKGLAGQGKSTILRKILSNTLHQTNRTPIFYELKNYRGDSLSFSMAVDLKQRGVGLNPSTIEALFDKPDTTVFLDAFDEVNPLYRDNVIKGIEYILSRNCRVIISTRPDTELDSLSVPTYAVQDLSHKQVNAIVRKTASDYAKANEIIRSLEKSSLHQNHEDGTVLKTPILVALLCVSYNLGESVPETLTQFYRNIFDTVFYKHDNLKGKVNRRRTWNDDRIVYLRIFEYLSFSNQRANENRFQRGDLVDRVESAMTFFNRKDGVADTIFGELCNITNLIFEDGFNTFRYAHRSIQEYFAATFIQSHLPIDKKREFYTKLINDKAFYRAWNGVLFFLKEIDYVACCEFFIVPRINNLLQIESLPMDSSLKLPSELLDKARGCIILDGHFRKVKNQRFGEGVDKEYKGIRVINHDLLTIAELALFIYFIENYVNQNKYKGEFLKIAMEEGVKRSDGGVFLTLEQFNSKANSKINYKAGLKAACLKVFSGEYNRAIADIENRTSCFKGDDVFQF